jgi:hypothetical protein
MKGPTRSPEEETTYHEGITSRQWIIMLGLAAVVCIGLITIVQIA